MNDDKANFKLTTDGVRGTIEVNGDDITSKVSRCVLEVGGGQPARLGIELRPGMEGEVTGDGIVEVMPNIVAGDLVQMWLDGIDPQVLATEVLQRQTMEGTGLMGADPVATALLVLKEMARGAADGT